MPKGTIKKIISDKGFGFISNGGNDLFFHRTAVEGCDFDDLYEGDTVEFEEGSGPKGPCATKVEKEN